MPGMPNATDAGVRPHQRAGPSPRKSRGINSDAKNEPKLMIQ